jgi:acetyl coenzyme A synthetase (ADP forming)-like protein
MGADADASTLDALFRPRSVAVIGASRRRESLSGQVFHNLISRRFPGAVYPVNPGSDVVQSVPAYPSIADVPVAVDLAVIVVPRDHVLPALEACGERGVRAAIVITAGFKETGKHGRALEDELLACARRHGMRLVGPNCLGVINTEPELDLNATFSAAWPPTGNVAFSSQSGALGVAILGHARSLGIGIRHFISVGNKADVSGNDLLEYWEKEPGVELILLYLESLGNPQRFMQIARRVARRKPIIVVKSGRTEAGAQAASSHTGSLAGLDVAVDALFEQAGVLRTDTLEELFDLTLLLANQPIPGGQRVGILTNAGGPGIMATDACVSRGLVLPELAADTVSALAAFLPPEASLRNPVDMIASAGPADFGEATRLLLADDAIDTVLVLYVPPVATDAPAVAEAIRDAAAGAQKPLLTCFMGLHGLSDALEPLRQGRIPSYAFPEAAALALSRAARYGRWLECPSGTVPELPDVQLARARNVVDSARSETGRPYWLDATEASELLSAYGIATPGQVLATNAEEAVRAATSLGYPVAIKLASATIIHKSDVGGVVLGVSNERGVREAFSQIRDRLEGLGRGAEMSGVNVQQMAPTGVETFIGVTQDPAYGALIGFGIGGVAVEIWRDVVFRVHPLTDVDAAAMLAQIRGAKLLDGYRGAAPADRLALAEALLRVSRLVGDCPEITELDLNPLVAQPPGQGVLAVDARILISRHAKG